MLGDLANRAPLLAAGLTALLALALAFAPVALGAGAPTGPHWPFVALAYWAQARPGSTPPLMVFGVGAVYEAVRDGPFGAELFALLIVIATLEALERRRPLYGLLVMLWPRVLVAIAGFEALVWALLATTYAPTPPLEALMARAVATALAFPLAALALDRLFGARRRERFASSAPMRGRR